jgi:hypothetical protein
LSRPHDVFQTAEAKDVTNQAKDETEKVLFQ